MVQQPRRGNSCAALVVKYLYIIKLDVPDGKEHPD